MNKLKDIIMTDKLGQYLPHLCLLSFVLHLLFWLSPLSETHYHIDASYYIALADTLVKEGYFGIPGEGVIQFMHTKGIPTIFWPPMYPLLLTPFSYFNLAHKEVVPFFQIIMFSFLPFFFYKITSYFCTGFIRNLIVLLSSFFPYFFLLITIVTPEVMAHFLCTIILLLTLQAKDKGFVNVLILGTLSGALALCRFEYLLYGAGAIFWLFLNYRGVTPKKSLLAALGMILTITPWLIRNYQITGKIVFSTRMGAIFSFHNLYNYNLTEKIWKNDAQVWDYYGDIGSLESEVERSDALVKKGLEFVKDYPVIYLKWCIKRVAAILLPDKIKSWLMEITGKRRLQWVEYPAWFDWSNNFFLLNLYAIVFPGLYLMFRHSRMNLGFLRSPTGLLLILIGGQLFIYIFIASMEYQRVIISFQVLLLGYSQFAKWWSGRRSICPRRFAGGRFRGAPAS